ncbi:Major facilitator superfamily MFS_1 [Syntrophobacter sp. SbD1]|nr:Major facilitator superfamily MFS_1 [Syntrophobacter sp. SbD1]
MATKTMSIREVFDSRPFTPYQMWICFLCFCVTLMDGFDLTMMGVTMPKIGEYLKVSPSALGLAVSAGMIGPLVGALLLGMLADRFGRRRMLFISALIFGFFTLLITQITDVKQLALLRFLAGIGLGGAIPNALAFGCEYAPSRMRATVTTMMWAGMAFGSAINGLAAVWLLPSYGWRSLFVVGGIVPVIICMMVAMLLPESLEFLVKQGTDKARIRRIISKIDPALAHDEEVQVYSSEQKLAGVPVKHLFMEGRAATTFFLWAAFFWSFYLIWIILAWAPTLLKQSGANVQQYSMAFFFINLGSALAIITIGRLMDKLNRFFVVIGAQALVYLSFVAFGSSAGSSFIIVSVVSVVCGFFIFGANAGVVALGTVSYPVDIRATGLGWAYAIGKVGTMVAPVVGGYCIAMKWDVRTICSVNGLGAVFVMASVFGLYRHLSARYGQDSKEAGAVSKVA